MNYEIKLNNSKKLIEDIDKLKASIKNLNEETIFKLEIILDELGSNSIKYANYSIAYINVLDDHLKIEFYTDGEKIPNFYIDFQNTEMLIKKCLEEGHGLGIYIVKNLADYFEYNYDNGMNKITVELKKDG